jgi:hypothetical protein
MEKPSMRVSRLSLFISAALSLCVVTLAFSNVLVVTTTADTGAASFRTMISRANSPGPDSIRFAIPTNDPGYDASYGTWRIRPQTEFYVITDGRLVIDGTSQAVFTGGDPNPNGPEIEIDGEDLPSVPCLTIMASDVIVLGLTINKSKSSAIKFQGAIGGKVLGCYLGTTSDGMAAAGNEYGVWILLGSHDVVVGQSGNSHYGNLLSGNQCGVYAVDSCVRISIAGNRIGVNRPGTDTLSNMYAGITIAGGCDDVNISENLIGGRGTGIHISNSAHGYIGKNSIGTDTAWNCNLGILDAGIMFDYYAQQNTAAWNSIGNCDRAGILVFGGGCVQNTLTMNKISKISQKGIENGFGGNIGLPPPAIHSVNTSTVTGTAGPGNTVEIFADDSSQGMDVLGSTKADASGAFVFPLAKPVVRKYVTTTATDLSGNTSEFSLPCVVTDVEQNSINGMSITCILEQNYPNPFNPVTTIVFRTPVQNAESRLVAPGLGRVKLAVYDLLGREVAVLVDEPKVPGEYTVAFGGARLATGVYLYRLLAGSNVYVKKMQLVK